MAGVTVVPGPAPAVAALFGDGTHPATRLARATLLEIVRRRPGVRVLDVGTGTGVLARAALEAGAGVVVGIDCASAAVDVARAHVPGATFLVADARDYLEQHGGAFDVVVANLPDPPLVGLVPDLAAAARPGGTLIVTGVRLWQAEAVSRSLARASTAPSSVQAEGGWAAFVADC